MSRGVSFRGACTERKGHQEVWTQEEQRCGVILRVAPSCMCERRGGRGLSPLTRTARRVNQCREGLRGARPGSSVGKLVAATNRCFVVEVKDCRHCVPREKRERERGREGEDYS